MPVPVTEDTTTRWLEPTAIPPTFNLATLNSNPLVARILYHRGFREADAAARFLDDEPQPAPDPFQLPNMTAAVRRIEQAVAAGGVIGVFGDYDVDGVTSTIVLGQALQAMAGKDRVIARVPERSGGYGINRNAVDAFAAAATSLLITVDCGSSDADAITYADSLGIDTIVVDHHRLPAEGPPPAIVVSPQLDPDGTYHDLTAVGVAWLLVTALAAHGHDVTTGSNQTERSFLDLVALGTVADVASLAGINRPLVRDGLALLREARRPGLRSLMRTSDLVPGAVTARDIAFRIGPRINAAGRVRSATLALDLLTTDDARQAEMLADALESLNIERRRQTEQIIVDACSLIEDRPGWEDQRVILVADSQWESGVVGLAASRLVEQYRRPVIVCREEDGILHGSARSIEGFSIVDALRDAAHLMIRYGGHSQAAGVTLTAGHAVGLEASLDRSALASGVPIPMPQTIAIDADLVVDDLDIRTVGKLASLEPFGVGNPSPVLRLAGCNLVKYSTIGVDRRHLKIQVTVRGRHVEAILWSGAHRSRELVMRTHVDLVGKLDINEFRGQRRLQMILDDFRITGRG